MITRPNFRAAVSKDCGWRFMSRTVNVPRTAAAGGRLVVFLEASLVFMSAIMSDIRFQGKFQFTACFT